MSLLKVNGIKKSFKINPLHNQNVFTKNILNGICFDLKEQEILTIMGPSGGGKSTFLKILAGIIEPNEGSIEFLDKPINIHKKEYLSQISFIFQDYKLIAHLNVFENVALVLRLRGVKNWEEEATKALEFMKIIHLRDSYPPLLSGGESQRVGIARAICIHPKIVFADEPTGNLDRKIGASIIDVFQDIKNRFKTSFVIVTHDLKIQEAATTKKYLFDGLLFDKDPYED